MYIIFYVYMYIYIQWSWTALRGALSKDDFKSRKKRIFRHMMESGKMLRKYYENLRRYY